MEIKLNYQIEDIVFAKKVLAKIREVEKNFYDLFSIKQKKLSLNFTIFNSREEYKNWTGYGDKYQNWIVGKCNGKNLAIITPKYAQRSEKEMIEVACHEVAHFLLEHNFKVKSTVLDEGFACFLAGQMPNENLKNPPTCEILEKDFASNGGYTFAPIYVKEIIENNGTEFFIKLLKNKKFYELLPPNFEKKAVARYKKTNQND